MFEHRESDPRRLVLRFCVLLPSEHCMCLHIPRTLFFSSSCEHRVALARLGKGSFSSPRESRERASVPFLVMTLLHFSWMSIIMGVHCLRDLYPPLPAFRSSPNCSSAPTWSIMNTLHSIVSTSFKPQICLDGLGCCPKTGLSHACIQKTRGGTSPVVQWKKFCLLM